MTTVYVSQPLPKGENNLFELMYDWISDENAVYPYDAVYREDETVEQNREEGAGGDDLLAGRRHRGRARGARLRRDRGRRSPASSQDTPGRRQARDRRRDPRGRTATEVADTPTTVVDAVARRPRPASRSTSSYAATASAPSVARHARRSTDGRRRSASSSAPSDHGVPGRRHDRHRPGHRRPERRADVLASASTTPSPRARSPTARPSPAPAPSTPPATVGPIGGIQQKIVGARDAGAELFLVPPDNCDEAARRAQRRHAPGRGAHHAQRPRVHRGLGRRTPTPTCPAARGDGASTRDDRASTIRAPDFDDVDPALAAAVLEIESHIAAEGWDQPARLYALVDTAALVAARARARRRDGPGRRLARQGSLTAGRAGPARARPAAGGSRSSRSSGRPRSPAAPPSSSGWCCRRTPTRRSPTTRTLGRGVRPRAPRPPGGPHRGRRDPRGRDVLCPAAARPRRRPVGRGRRATWCRRCWSCCARRWRSPEHPGTRGENQAMSELFDEESRDGQPPPRRGRGAPAR